MFLDQRLRLGSGVSAVVGLVVSLYLTWSKVANTPVLCGPIGDCDTVNSSQYSEFFGIPIALMGVLVYLGILLLLHLESQGKFWIDNGNLVVFGLSLVGTLYSAYLTYIEITVLRAVCPYCVVSAIAITVIMGLSFVRLLKDQREFLNE